MNRSKSFFGTEPIANLNHHAAVLILVVTTYVNETLGKEAMKTVLLIDDNEEYRESVRIILESEGLEVFDTDCPDAAFSLLRSMDAPDLIICDVHMPFTTGPEQDEFETSYNVGVKTVHELSWVYPDTPVIAMSAAEFDHLRELRKSLDPIPAYQKPFRIRDMVEMVHSYLICREHGGMH